VANLNQSSHGFHPVQVPVVVPPPVQQPGQRAVAQSKTVTSFIPSSKKHRNSQKITLITFISILSGAIIILLLLTSTSSNSKYEVNCEVKKGRGGNTVISVEVKGKAEKLAVLMTTPNGKTESRIIEKKSLMANSTNVNFAPDTFEQGTYNFVVKLFDSEKIITTKKFDVSVEKIWVDKVDIKFAGGYDFWGKLLGMKIDKVAIFCGKKGNLPVPVEKMEVSINGLPCKCEIDKRASNLIIDEKNPIEISIISFKPTQQMINATKKRKDGNSDASMFRLGDKCTVKGKLIYGENKDLEFEKEIVFTKDLLR